MKTTMTMKKLALASLTVASVLALAAGCSRSHPQYAPEAAGLEYAPVGPRAEPEGKKATEFSGLAVVNGKPYGDMYFKSYGVNPTVDTDEERVSTFSVDVDTRLVHAGPLLPGARPPPGGRGRARGGVRQHLRLRLPGIRSAPFGVQVEAFPSPNRQAATTCCTSA